MQSVRTVRLEYGDGVKFLSFNATDDPPSYATLVAAVANAVPFLGLALANYILRMHYRERGTDSRVLLEDDEDVLVWFRDARPEETLLVTATLEEVTATNQHLRIPRLHNAQASTHPEKTTMQRTTSVRHNDTSALFSPTRLTVHSYDPSFVKAYAASFPTPPASIHDGKAPLRPDLVRKPSSTPPLADARKKSERRKSVVKSDEGGSLPFDYAPQFNVAPSHTHTPSHAHTFTSPYNDRDSAPSPSHQTHHSNSSSNSPGGGSGRRRRRSTSWATGGILPLATIAPLPSDREWLLLLDAKRQGAWTDVALEVSKEQYRRVLGGWDLIRSEMGAKEIFAGEVLRALVAQDPDYASFFPHPDRVPALVVMEGVAAQSALVQLSPDNVRLAIADLIWLGARHARWWRVEEADLRAMVAAILHTLSQHHVWVPSGAKDLLAWRAVLCEMVSIMARGMVAPSAEVAEVKQVVDEWKVRGSSTGGRGREGRGCVVM